jgi:hypothetical protein
MNVKKMYEFDDDELNALIAFLNRSNYRGLQEVQMINKIMESLSKPMAITQDKNPVDPPKIE